MAPVVSGFQVSPREAQGRIPARAQVPGPCSEAGLPSNGVTSAEPITCRPGMEKLCRQLICHIGTFFYGQKNERIWTTAVSGSYTRELTIATGKMASTTERSRKY